MNQRIDKAGLVRRIRDQFQCDWRGIHGPSHWGRVRLNGLFLADQYGANAHVVELFALLHDSQRHNEWRDPDHGKRAASWARELNGQFFDADESELELLSLACELHSDGALEADLTVQCCWDADRLDLWRVGVKPDPRYLCTPMARRIALGDVGWPSRKTRWDA